MFPCVPNLVEEPSIVRPTVVNWSITSKCDLRCKFCFGRRDEEASKEDKLAILSNLIDAGVKRITFTGGEPLLDDQLLSLLEICKARSVFTSLHTNGTKAKRFSLACHLADRVSLSLDGPDGQTNALMRGRDGFFNTVMSRLDFLASSNMDFAIKTVVTRENIGSIPEMIPIIEKYKPTFWGLQEFRPIRTGACHSERYSLEKGEFADLISQLQPYKIALNTMSRDEAGAYPIFLVSGRGFVYTNTPDGDVVVGSLFTEDVAAIWETILARNELTDKCYSKYSIIRGGSTSI